MSKLKQFALDSISNYFNMFMKIGIYFISVPICLDVYGKELYGVFLLTFGIASSFMLFDFGVSNSLIRYASAHKRTKDIKQFSEEISYSISTLFYSIFLVCIIFLVLAFFGFKIFKIPEEYLQISSDLFLVSAFYIITIFSFNFTKFFLNGLGHFFLRNLLQTLNIVITLVNIALIYFYEIGIIWFAILSMLPNIVGIIIDIYYLNKKEKRLVKSLVIKVNLRWNYVDLFRNAKVLFSSRMHSLFVAGLVGTPFVPIVVHPKLKYATELFYKKPVMLDSESNLESYQSAFRDILDKEFDRSLLDKEIQTLNKLDDELEKWIIE